MFTKFSRGQKGRDHLEDLGVDVRKILKWILWLDCGGSGMALDRDRWQAVV
jgi:hypothetical protein